MVLCDTDVFIEYFKGDKNTKRKIDKIGVENFATSPITVMELYFGALNKRELTSIKRALSGL